MTHQEVIRVCDSLLLLNCFDGIPAQRDKTPSVGHLVWMIYEIKKNAHIWREGKVGRWLGFIQGVLCFQGITTIEKERKRNTMFFVPEECPHTHTHTENYDPMWHDWDIVCDDCRKVVDTGDAG